MAMGGANAPAYIDTGYLYGLPSADTLRMDELLDLSNNNDHFAAADVHHLPVQPDSVSTPVGSKLSGCFSDQCYPHSSSSFADDIYVPSEEAAELEWLSKFVEDSFSDVPYPPASIPNHVYSNTQIRTDHATSNRGARSKRSRAPTAAAMLAAAAAGNWPSQRQASSSSTSSSSSSDLGGGRRRSAGGADSGVGVDESGVRRCTHCASEKTPQWRAGPLGPKTLCNACGVRYKSGRLVPEYRPAASPSFVLTQHSNSHRKVVELRRQKEAQQQQQQHRHQSNSSSRLDLMYS